MWAVPDGKWIIVETGKKETWARGVRTLARGISRRISMKWGLTMGPENSDREKSLRGRRNGKARSLMGLISKEKAHMPLWREEEVCAWRWDLRDRETIGHVHFTCTEGYGESLEDFRDNEGKGIRPHSLLLCHLSAQWPNVPEKLFREVCVGFQEVKAWGQGFLIPQMLRITTTTPNPHRIS